MPHKGIRCSLSVSNRLTREEIVYLKSNPFLVFFGFIVFYSSVESSTIRTPDCLTHCKATMCCLYTAIFPITFSRALDSRSVQFVHVSISISVIFCFVSVSSGVCGFNKIHNEGNFLFYEHGSLARRPNLIPEDRVPFRPIKAVRSER